MWAIYIDLVLVWEPKLTWFFAGLKIDLVFVCGSKITCFSVSMEIDLVFVMVQIDLISVWRIELELISV